MVLPADQAIASYDDGVQTWKYVGQARLPVHPTIERELWSVEPDYVITSIDYDPDEYLGVGVTTALDAEGRLWLLDTVDVDAANAKIQKHRIDTAKMFGGVSEPSGGDDWNPGIEYNESPGEWSLLYPQSWTTQECDSSDPGPEIYEHDPDTINKVTASYNEWQKKSVVIFIWGGVNAMCSGTLVDNNSVLTAGHCLADSSGYLTTAGNYKVCTYGNVQSPAVCHVGSTIVTPGGTWDGSKADDYGLINLSSSFSVGWFGIADASDGTLNNYPDRHQGYPGYADGCVDNVEYSDTVTINDTYYGAYLHQTVGTIQSTPTGYIKFDTGSGDGFSGGVHFYCPNGSGCGNGHYLTAVHGGVSYSAFFDTGYSYGAKGRDINDWVVANQ